MQPAQYYWSQSNSYFIFTFFQTQLLAYNLEKYIHLVLMHQDPPLDNSHMDADDKFWHSEPHRDWLPSLKFMFSYLTDE